MTFTHTPRYCRLLAIGLILSTPSVVQAAQFAAAVVSYSPGGAAGSGVNTATSALGSPDGLSGEGLGFPNVLSPFSPSFEADEIVQIGEGGEITLRLSHYVIPGAGLELGVFTNVGLADEDFPNGKAGNPPFTFGVDSAVVEVSENGVAWVSLGSTLFDLPTNYYLDSGPFDSTPGNSPADFGKPFGGTLTDFSGLDYSQILALLDGSAGGRWLDLSGTGLSQIGYARFLVPDDGNPATALTFELDAVSISNAAVGSLVPEPASWLLLASGGATALIVARRRGRNGRDEV
jgi:hypothetical protein